MEGGEVGPDNTSANRSKLNDETHLRADNARHIPPNWGHMGVRCHCSCILAALVAAVVHIYLTTIHATAHPRATKTSRLERESQASLQRLSNDFCQEVRNITVPELALPCVRALEPCELAGSLAVVVAGLKQRFILNSTLRHVVMPTAKTCYQPDVYIMLGNEAAAMWHPHGDRPVPDPMLAGRSASELELLVAELVACSGGRLLHFELRRTNYELPLGDGVPYLKRFEQYSPWSTNEHERTTGINALRRHKNWEDLWGSVRSHEVRQGFRYDFVLRLRGDDFWLAPLRLPTRGLTTANTLYTANCLEHGWGVNDKILLMGRQAAEHMMMAFSAFWLHDDRLNSINTESYTRALAEVSGVDLRPVPFMLLAGGVAIFTNSSGAPALCLRPKDFVGCTGLCLPRGAPEFCRGHFSPWACHPSERDFCIRHFYEHPKYWNVEFHARCTCT